jgi:hypothetical protein
VGAYRLALVSGLTYRVTFLPEKTGTAMLPSHSFDLLATGDTTLDIALPPEDAYLWVSGLVRLLGPVDSDDGGRRRRRAGWLAYALGMAIALNTIGAAAPSFIAINAIVAILAALRRLPAGWPMRAWLLVNLAVLVAWLPGLTLLVLANSVAATRGLDWIPPLTFEMATNIFASLYMLQLSDLLTFERLAAPVPLIGLAVVALAVAGGTVLAPSPRGIVLIGLTLVMPVTLMLISLAKPMFVPRYLLWSTGPFFVLAGVGLAAIPALLPRAAITAAVMLGAAFSLRPYYGGETKPRWDLAAAYLAEQVAKGDATVVSSGLARVMLGTYLARHAGVAINVLDVQSKEEILSTYGRGASVWLIHGRAGQGGNLIARADFTARWAEIGPARETRMFGRHIAIWRHARQPASP